jgi:AcrR family transcriptional regulator
MRDVEKRETSRDLQRRETYQRIFEAAMAEFDRVGVEKAQIDRICEASGVARGTFYFHFPTKDHVLLERQRQLSEKIAERLEKELGATGSARRCLARVAEVAIEEREAVGNLELVREIDAAVVRRSRTPNLSIDATPFGHMLIRNIRRLQEAGEVRDDLSPAALADTFRLSLFGFLMDPQRPGKDLLPRVRLMIDLFVDALRPRGESAA